MSFTESKLLEKKTLPQLKRELKELRALDAKGTMSKEFMRKWERYYDDAILTLEKKNDKKS